MRSFLTIATLASLLAGCAQPAELPERRVRELMEIWETGEVERLDDIVAPAVVYDDVPNGERFSGLEGVRRYVGHVHSWAGQVEITISEVHSGEDTAIAEWVMRGIQDRPIPGRVPVATNRPFRLQGVTLVEIHDGRITRAADYIDVLGFVVQLGGRVELPGGVVIPPDSSAAREGGAAD